MHVILTRAGDDNAGMRARLEARGIAVSVAPMLNVVFNPLDADHLAGFDGLIVTSRNALKALAASGGLEKLCDRAVFAVGPATAAMARSLGFTHVIDGPGTAAELAVTIAGTPSARQAKLAHLAGQTKAHDLEADLGTRGLDIATIEAYHTVAAKTLPSDVHKLMAEGAADAVILMSPATARSWIAATDDPAVKAQLTKVVHLCLSEAVARAFGPNPRQKIEIPLAPNGEQMLALAFRLAANFEAE